METIREIPRNEKFPHSLKAVLLFRPDAHPAWSHYLVSVIDLRAEPGETVYKKFSDATHEISIIALDPDYEPDPNDIEAIRYLVPQNLAYHLRNVTDALAVRIFDDFVELLRRELSPDTDFSRRQNATLDFLFKRHATAN